MYLNLFDTSSHIILSTLPITHLKRLDGNLYIAMYLEFTLHTNMHLPAQERSMCCKHNDKQNVTLVSHREIVHIFLHRKVRGEVKLSYSLLEIVGTEWFAQGHFSKVDSCWQGGSSHSPWVEEQSPYSNVVSQNRHNEFCNNSFCNNENCRLLYYYLNRCDTKWINCTLESIKILLFILICYTFYYNVVHNTLNFKITPASKTANPALTSHSCTLCVSDCDVVYWAQAKLSVFYFTSQWQERRFFVAEVHGSIASKRTN